MSAEIAPSPSLLALASYARSKAAEEQVSVGEAELWLQIADEIDSYLDHPEQQQPALFDEATA